MFFTSFLPLGVTSRSTLQERCGFLTGSPHSDPRTGFYLPRSSRRRGFLASLLRSSSPASSSLIQDQCFPQSRPWLQRMQIGSSGIPVCLYTRSKRVSGLLFDYLPILYGKEHHYLHQRCILIALISTEGALGHPFLCVASVLLNLEEFTVQKHWKTTVACGRNSTDGDGH